MEIVFTLGSFIVAIVCMVLGYIERKDMLDRLMSKNIVEYKSLQEEENHLEEEPSSLIPILEAKEEILNES